MTFYTSEFLPGCAFPSVHIVGSLAAKLPSMRSSNVQQARVLRLAHSMLAGNIGQLVLRCLLHVGTEKIYISFDPSMEHTSLRDGPLLNLGFPRTVFDWKISRLFEQLPAPSNDLCGAKEGQLGSPWPCGTEEAW